MYDIEQHGLRGFLENSPNRGEHQSVVAIQQFKYKLFGYVIRFEILLVASPHLEKQIFEVTCVLPRVKERADEAISPYFCAHSFVTVIK